MIDEISLNSQQYNAVVNPSGPIVVCAGAGSGKTRVIAHRTFHLINVLGCDPRAITCVTFTNKAANEMRERIAELLQGNIYFPIITTFHGYALRLIRQYGAILDISNYTIIDEDTQKDIIRRIMAECSINDKDITIRKIIYYISSIKNNPLFESFIAESEQKYSVYKALYHYYEAEKTKSKCFDFDDILIYGLKLLENDFVLNDIRLNTKHLLIDEYQDTNHIQHSLVKKIAINKDNNFVLDSLCVVGDEDQSIYSWRGANVHNITNFKNDFPEAKLITLTQNYRSVDKILDLANCVISRNKIRNPKELWTAKKTTNPVFLIEYYNGYLEAEGVINIIISLKKEKKTGNCAILYRSHYQSRLFEEFCITNNVKYKVFGGINFYERQEIKDIIAYVKIAINKYDRQSFLRVCNTPVRGFGPAAQNLFLDFWNQNLSLPLDLCLNEYINKIDSLEKSKIALRKILSIIEDVNSVYNTPSKAISYIIKEIEYNSYIDKISETPDEARERKENIAELIEAAKMFEQQFENATISDFLDHLSLMLNTEKDVDFKSQEDISPVILMTVHASKGLEFSTVFIVGLEEGVFPSTRASDSIESFEEERRLLYVGITRACDRLVCSFANSRNLWGTNKLQIKSSFLKDFSKDVFYIDAKKMPKYIFEKMLNINDLEVLKKFENKDNNFINDMNNFKKDFFDKDSFVNVNKIKKGNKVSHSIFGNGLVISISDDVCVVKFSDKIRNIKASYLK
jgi:DNA helicase-2/ATP-dependent DNA helicase PcrA